MVIVYNDPLAYASSLRLSGVPDNEIISELEKQGMSQVDLSALPEFRTRDIVLKELIDEIENKPVGLRTGTERQNLRNYKEELASYYQREGNTYEANKIYAEFSREEIAKLEKKIAPLVANQQQDISLTKSQMINLGRWQKNLDKQKKILQGYAEGGQMLLGDITSIDVHSDSPPTRLQRRDLLNERANLQRQRQREIDSKLTIEQTRAREKDLADRSDDMTPQNPNLDYLVPESPPTWKDPLEYKPHQLAAIEYALERGGETGQKGVLIADPPGAGKTVTALGIANNLPGGPAKRVLVVAPNSLKEEWHRHGRLWLVNKMPISVVRGGANVPHIEDDESQMVIINYEQMRNPNVALKIGETPWDIVILDESDALINYGTLQTAGIIGGEVKSAKGKQFHAPLNARFKVAMTGTPTDILPEHLYNTLSYLDPDYWGDPHDKEARNRFVKRYSEVNKNGEFLYIKNASELQRRLRSNGMILRSEDDILSVVPKPIRRLNKVDKDHFTPAEYEVVQEMEEVLERVEKLRNKYKRARRNPELEESEIEEMLRKEKIEILAEFARVKRKTGEAKTARVGQYVADAVEKARSEKGYKRPIIVFSWHHNVLDKIKDKLLASGVPQHKIAQMDGRTPEPQRKEIIRNFQNRVRPGEPGYDPDTEWGKYHVMLAGMGVGGKGLNLQNANHIIFSELEWQPKQISQAEHRAYRMGQDTNVIIDHILLSGGIDEFIAATLHKKYNSVNSILGGHDRTQTIMPSTQDVDDILTKEKKESMEFLYGELKGVKSLQSTKKKTDKDEDEKPDDKEIFDWIPVGKTIWKGADKVRDDISSRKGQIGQIYVRTTRQETDRGIHEPVKLILVSDNSLERDKFILYTYRDDTGELARTGKTYPSYSDAKDDLDRLPPYVMGNTGGVWEEFQLPVMPQEGSDYVPKSKPKTESIHADLSEPSVDDAFAAFRAAVESGQREATSKPAPTRRGSRQGRLGAPEPPRPTRGTSSQSSTRGEHPAVSTFNKGTKGRPRSL